MADPVAELSSVSTALDELTRRLGAIAADQAERDEMITAELFEVERALNGAQRRLAKLVDGRNLRQ